MTVGTRRSAHPRAVDWELSTLCSVTEPDCPFVVLVAERGSSPVGWHRRWRGVGVVKDVGSRSCAHKEVGESLIACDDAGFVAIDATDGELSGWAS